MTWKDRRQSDRNAPGKADLPSDVVQLYEGLSALTGTYTFSDGLDTPIVRAAHGDSSGVRGAAWLWSAVTPT
jgi:hypothetical protein